MLKIYCDGACSGNPGPGGWAFVIPKLDGFEQSGFEKNTTNNRMELTAVIEALKCLYEDNRFIGDDVEVITDSQYVVNTMTKGWQKKKNVDLWSILDYYIYYFGSIKWTWVKGHADNRYNNRCDQLAVSEYKSWIEYHKQEIEEEKERELQWYGELMPLDLNQKIDIRFVPYEKYNVGKNHFVLISKCTAIDNGFIAEADNVKLLCIGTYAACKNAVKNYKMQAEDDFRSLPF